MARIYRRTIQKKLNDPDNHDGVIIHLELDILECKVKWALRSVTRNKASGGDGIPAELFQVLKDDAVKGLHSICQQILKTQQWPQDWKSQFSFQSQRVLGSAKECTNYQTIALISHVSKVKLKILQASLQQCVNREHPDVQAGFRKGRGTRDQIANICWITEKAREFQKNFCFIDYAKAFDWVDHNKLVKFLKRWQCLSTLPASWEPFCIQVKKQQLEPDMEQWTGSKLGKEYDKAIYCHTAYLT